MFKHNYSILLVDDENCARKLIGERISKMQDVDVVTSLPNAFSAKKFLQEHVVDILFTDINMPLMDGLELAAFTKKIAPSCPVVIISGYGEFEYARKAIQYGVKEYLLKPVTLSQIREVVEHCCNEVQKRREELLSVQNNVYEELEQQLFKSFMKGESMKCWFSNLEQMLEHSGTIVRLEPEVISDRKKEELSIIYKNILCDALPGQMVLRLGYTQERYEYLVIPKCAENYRQLKAVPEYLNRILKHAVKWTEVCNVNSAQELAQLCDSNKEETGNTQIEAACRYMEEHLGEMLTREQVAESVWLSPSYFSHLFKRHIGVGYNEYLTELRIKQAKRMLAQKVTISDIAVSVGFRDARYFSNIFQKKTGYTPSEYRHALLKGDISQEE